MTDQSYTTLTDEFRGVTMKQWLFCFLSLCLGYALGLSVAWGNGIEFRDVLILLALQL